MNDRISINQIEKSYKKAVKDVQTPYRKVLGYQDRPKPGTDFVLPPQVMRNYFGIAAEKE